MRRFLLESMNVLYKHAFGTTVSTNGLMREHSVNEGEVSIEQEKIKKFINSDEPVMLARFGTFELFTFINYLQVTGQMKDSGKYNFLSYIRDKCYPNFYTRKAKHFMLNNAGFFPVDDESLTKWGNLVKADLELLDALFIWQDAEKYIESYTNSAEKIICSDMYYPYMFKNPWTEALEGKKVLVISPFAPLIESQYKNNRTKLFKDKKVLPEFKELKTIEAYNVLGGNNSYENINSWFDALENMKEKMDNVDYDIALIGCGAYAFDLAAHAKRMGKKSITMCGSHSILFGIYGTRFSKYLDEIGVLNEYWIRPGDKFKPEGYEKVENGAYW